MFLTFLPICYSANKKLLHTAKIIVILKEKAPNAERKEHDKMWTKSQDDINRIFTNKKKDYQLENLRLYNDNKKISEGFLFIKSVNLYFEDDIKEAIFHCIYLQPDISIPDSPSIQIKWQAYNYKDSRYDIDFDKAIYETDPVSRLQAYPDVIIHDEDEFKTAIRIILKEVLKWRRNEMWQHVGWDFRYDDDGDIDYSFWGNLDEFHLTQQGEHIGTYSILPENDETPFSFSELENLFDQLDPAVCYPLFLSVVYSMVDPEIFGYKNSLFVNICGNEQIVGLPVEIHVAEDLQNVAFAVFVGDGQQLGSKVFFGHVSPPVVLICLYCITQADQNQSPNFRLTNKIHSCGFGKGFGLHLSG